MIGYFIKLNAPNDSNGNPRRVVVLYDHSEGLIVDSEDEGYQGESAAVAELKARNPNYVRLPLNYAIPPVEVPTRVYREHLRHSKSGKK